MNKIRLEIYDNKFYEDPGGGKNQSGTLCISGEHEGR